MLLLVAALPATAKAPTLRGLRGGQLAEADLAKGTSIIVVWASWSPKCRDIVARVNPVASAWAGSARVATVAFRDEAPAVEAFLGALPALRAPVYLDEDGGFGKEYAITDLPGLLIVRDGKALFRGRLPADPDSVIRRHLG